MKVKNAKAHPSLKLLTATMILAVGVTGCANNGPSKLDSRKVSEVDHKSQGLIAERIAQESAKLFAIQTELAKNIVLNKKTEQKPVEPKFNPLDSVKVTIQLDNADVRNVFKAIADQAKLNLILPDSLSKRPRKVSMSLRDVPASNVFENVLKNVDLSGSIEGNILIVRDLEERTYDLDFLQTFTSANFDAGGDIFGANRTNNGNTGNAGVRSAFNIRGQNSNDVNPYDQIEKLLKTVVLKDAGAADALKSTHEWGSQSGEGAPADDNGEGPRYVLNKTTGSLYVKGRPSQVATITRLINDYKSIMGRQVLIEAQILDVELNDEFQYGVDWNLLRGRLGGSFGSNPMNINAITGSLPNGSNPGQSITIPAKVLGTLGVPSLGLSYAGKNSNFALDMMQMFGTVHVISNPSLRVKNTQPAVVSVGTNERYISQSSASTQNGATSGLLSTTSSVITDNVFDGVMLGVIPFIAADGSISLLINPMQTKVQPGSMKLVDVGSTQNPMKISLPKVDFKGLTTSLSLQDGDVVILGGLISDEGSRAKQGLPGWSDVPVLGEMFSSQGRTTNVRELILILRVQIL